MLKKWIDGTRYYYGTLIFCLFNQNFELSVEDLGHILIFPIYGPEDVPNEFLIKNFWGEITGSHFYTASRAKASIIKNPCFGYAKKALAYTLFGQEDSTNVATQRELFFMYCKVHIITFAANYLGKVARVATGGISVGDLITQIIEHLVLEFNLAEDRLVEGKNKIDMYALVHQVMI